MNFTAQSYGIIYVATGTRHVAEAVRSAQSVRKHMPQVPIILYTDQVNVTFKVFTEIWEIDQPLHSFGDKILPLKETPFERTLFLDTDTYVCGPIYDLFEILERFDLAASHAPYRPARSFVTPNCFCELNSGVIAYRKTPETTRFFDNWFQLYQTFVATTDSTPDQPAFRQALYESSLQLYILPPEYNLRTIMPGFSGRGSVKILHGRGVPMQRLENWINGSRNIRVFLSSPRQLTRDHLEILSPKGRYITAVLTTFIQPLVKVESILRPWKRRFLKIYR